MVQGFPRFWLSIAHIIMLVMLDTGMAVYFILPPVLLDHQHHI